MTFDPMSVEVTCVTLPKDHCVQVPWQFINVCGYSDQFCKIPHTYIHTTYYIHKKLYILRIHTTYRMSDHIVSYWTPFRRDKKKRDSVQARQKKKGGGICNFSKPGNQSFKFQDFFSMFSRTAWILFECVQWASPTWNQCSLWEKLTIYLLQRKCESLRGHNWVALTHRLL